ncbi:translation initiation factor IF-2 [Elysia marginata]|uniref:Translation initiation factor IF-2 n=1 Tax=Elysia marginata TaxID=1093978 RepID=A0AAV4FD27_9GAST|nr:translation initiation factor IF-2 [Elysia marginata]
MNLLPVILLASVALFAVPSAGQGTALAAALLARRNRYRYNYYRYPYSYYYPNYRPQGQGQASGKDEGSSADKDKGSDEDKSISSDKDQGSHSGQGQGSHPGQGQGSHPSDKGQGSHPSDKGQGSSSGEGGRPSGQGRRPSDQGQRKKQPRSLCPPDPVMRSLNSKPVKSKGGKCQFDQVASITTLGGQTVACNAALTKAKVDGVMKKTFVTSALCSSMVDQLVDNPKAGLEMRLGSKTFSLKYPFKTKVGPDGLAFLDLPEDSPILTGLDKCEKPSCAFNPDTMEDKVDMGDCKMISHGATDNKEYKFKGKHQVDLIANPFGCSELPDMFGAANTKCMESKSGQDVFCVGDNGAPIYCKAPSTDEWILIGVAAGQNSCGGTSEIKVIPVAT